MHGGLKLSGRYALQALLGRGGMGEVWLAVDEQLDRPVAVKVLRDDLADPELAGRFRREARIAARLQHPGITVVHDVGSDNGQLFIVMELLHGRDLAAMLAQAPTGLPIDAAVSLTIQAADALQALHAGDVVHRDLKPANLFLQDSGQLKICDFGIALAFDSATRLTATGQAIGTAAYMSPEQCRGQHLDKRSDLYSLGCVLYALLTGQPPFAQGQPLVIMHQHLNTAPAPPRTIRPDIPPELDHLVLELLAKDPARRPPTDAHVIAALQVLRYTPTVKVELAAKASPQPGRGLAGPPRNESGFLVSSDETVASASTRLPSPPSTRSNAITQVPRTEAQRRHILLSRPDYWEFLSFAGQLLYERDSVEAKYRNHRLRYILASRRIVIREEGVNYDYLEWLNDAKDIINHITQQFDEATRLARKMEGLFNDNPAIEQAFGAPGEEGNPKRLARLAKSWNDVYEEFLDWAADLRRISVPSEFQVLLELAARYADEPIEKYRRFVDDYAAQVEMLFVDLEAGRPLRIEARLVFSNPEKVIQDYRAELNRLRSGLRL